MDTGATSDLPAAVFETGHFGAVPHPHTAPLASWKHELRRRARVLAKEDNPQVCWREGFRCTRHTGSYICPVLSSLDVSARQRHFEEQLKDAQYFKEASFQTRRSRVPLDSRQERRHVARNRHFPSEFANDVALARGGDPLPGERHHRRCPSLERQEAFYDQSTARGKVRILHRPASEDAQVAELYHQGLLYNSQDAIQNTFDLNSIRHAEPTYIIRPAKSARKSGKRKALDGTGAIDNALHLNLSFSDIGDDEAIARYLHASQQASPDETIQHASSQESASWGPPPPVRIIYELAGSQGSVDVDASQPPDLIFDDEFELLSDSEMRDSPLDDATHSGPEPSSATWVLVGDDL